MDFQLTEEQRLVQETARGFVDRELIPHVREWEAKGEVPKAFYRKMADLGFLGAPVPEKYGGAGMDYVSFMLLVEELSRGSSSVRTTVSVQTSLSETSLMWFGSEAQKAAWLVPLAKGQKFGAWALTEPEAGSDAGDLQTTARPEKDEWGLNGRSRRRGPCRPGGRVEIRQRAQGVRPADRRLPARPRDDRAVRDGNRRGSSPHAPRRLHAGSGARQYARSLDGQALRSADGAAGHGLGHPSPWRGRGSAAICRSAGLSRCADPRPLRRHERKPETHHRPADPPTIREEKRAPARRPPRETL